MILEQLAKRGDKRAIFILDAFDPNQPRDENGMWTAGGGGLKTGAGVAASAASLKAHTEQGGKRSDLHHMAAVAHRAAMKEAGVSTKEGAFHAKAAELHRELGWKNADAETKERARQRPGTTANGLPSDIFEHNPSYGHSGVRSRRA